MSDAGGVEAQVYFLGGGRAGSPEVSRESAGSKAYNLMRMDRLGLPVPPGFVLTTGFCRDYYGRGRQLPEDFPQLLAGNVRRLEEATGCTFGGGRRPLLVAVRSGAPVSMPGMMETLLNIGLNTHSVRGLLRRTGNPRLAWDCYRRLLEGWAEVVAGLPRRPFSAAVECALAADQLPAVQELDARALEVLTRDHLDRYRQLAGEPFPQDPMEQLLGAVRAVLDSWSSRRAAEYRRLNGLDEEAGTAVLVQAMVFGNAGGRSGSGVAFTRNPATGEDELFIDFLFNAQGEDLVAGRQASRDPLRLADALPAVYDRLERARHTLEAELGDMQDFELTVQDGELFLLQTRTGKRTPWAALRIAVDQVAAGLLDPATALGRLDGLDLATLERKRLKPAGEERPLATAVPASLGVAVGRVAFDPEHARRRAAGGEPVILVRGESSTEDIAAMAVVEGILTAGGGRTSHAAVVARQLGKVCLVGCGELSGGGRRWSLGGRPLAEGDWLSLDGDDGAVYAGRLGIERERPLAALAEVERWRAKIGEDTAPISASCSTG